MKPIIIKVGDFIQWNGCIGLVTSIQNQFPDGSGRQLKNMQVRIDAKTMDYGRHHPDQVKRLA